MEIFIRCDCMLKVCILFVIYLYSQWNIALHLWGEIDLEILYNVGTVKNVETCED
jgi:hypothetical protein